MLVGVGAVGLRLLWWCLWKQVVAALALMGEVRLLGLVLAGSVLIRTTTYTALLQY